MADRFYNLYYNIVANQAINTNQQMAQSFQSVQTIANQTAITINNTYTDLSNSIGTANSRLGQTPGHVGAISDAFLQMRAAMIVFHEIETVISAIGTGLQDAREYANQTAEANLKLRDTLRELAAIEGKPGPGREVTDEVIDLRVKSGMREQEAVKFASTFQSDIQAASPNLIPEAGQSKEQMQEQIKIRTAQMAVRLGIGPDAARGMAVSMMQSHPMKMQDFEAEMAVTVANLQEAKGQFTPLMSQTEAALQPMMAAGAVSGMPELSVLTAGMSLGTRGSRIETREESLLNMVEKGRLKDKGLDKYVSPGDHNLLHFINRIAPDLQKAGSPDQDKDGDLLGEGQHAFLLGLGLTEQRGRIELMAMARPATLEFMNRQMERTRDTLTHPGKKAAAAAANIAADETFKLRDDSGRFAESERDRGNYLRGKQNEQLVKLRMRSEGTLHERGLLDTTGTSRVDKVWDTVFSPLISSGLLRGSREQRVDTEGARLLIESAEGIGISREQLGKSLPSLFMSGSPGVPNAAITPEQLANASNKLLGSSNQSAELMLRKMTEILEKMHAAQLAAMRVADTTPALPAGVGPQIAPPPNAGGPVRN